MKWREGGYGWMHGWMASANGRMRENVHGSCPAQICKYRSSILGRGGWERRCNLLSGPLGGPAAPIIAAQCGCRLALVSGRGRQHCSKHLAAAEAAAVYPYGQPIQTLFYFSRCCASEEVLRGHGG